MSKSSTKNVATETNPGTETRLKVSMSIITKIDHEGFIGYRLKQMPPVYQFKITKQENGYKVAVEFDTNGDTNKYFVTRYLAGMAGEIRMLDESNYNIEAVTVNKLASKSTLVE